MRSSGVSRWFLGPCSEIRKRCWFVDCVLGLFGSAKGGGKRRVGKGKGLGVTTKY